MSDLQIGLLVVGACVIAGVYLFNVWQERQFRRRAELAFAREHDDVLLREAPAQEESSAASAERVEPRLQVAAQGASMPARDAIKAPSAMLVDPLIDYVMEVNLPSAVRGADLHDELLGLAAAWNKAVLVAGHESASGEWRAGGLAGDADFARLRFALQMSNRAGCIELNQMIAFRDAVLKWTERNHGDAKFQDVAEGQAMAAQLDRFCSDVDIAIGINVVAASASPFSGTKIRALAEAAGLKLEPDGVFYARNDRGAVRFTLDNHEPMPFVPEQMKTLTTRGVTFLLDVPRADDALRAFDAMLEMARSFAAALDGALVDDHRAVLSDEAIAKIRHHVQTIAAKMEAGQIAAGGTRALRLFS